MQKFLTSLIFLFIIFYLPRVFCFAEDTNEEAIIKSYEKMQRMHEREQDILERQKKERELQKELDKLMEERKAADKNASEGNISEKLSAFLITEIIFENATLINKSQKAKLISGYINKRLNLNDIKALANDIINFYVKAGYPDAKVRIETGQNLKNGTLKLLIIENIIKEIGVG